MLDDSDFSTESRHSSQLDTSMNDVERAGLIPGIM
jgi:hypothetical protein